MRRQVQPHKGRDPARRFTRNRLSRGRGLRETTGCLTCRRRHVKCDEAKPKCKACSRIDKPCAWPDAAPSVSDIDGENSTSMQSRQGSHDTAVQETEPAEYSVSTDHQLQAETSENGFASPGCNLLELSPVMSPNSQRNATDGWSDRSDLAARVSNATTQSQTNPTPVIHTDPLQRSLSSTHEDKSPGADRATEYILSPSSIQSIPQTLGASPNLHSLGPFTNDWTHVDSSAPQSFNVDDAASAWASLLLRDASSRIDGGGDTGLELPGLDLNGALGPSIRPLPPAPAVRVSDQQQGGTFTAERPAIQGSSLGAHATGLQYEHDKPWQSSVSLKLEKHEYLLFHDFVQNLSLWMDFFDPQRPFGTIVPHLAMRNVGLMNAILALSIRHLSLNVRFQPKDSRPQDPLDALPFYFMTLHYIRKAMQYDSYKSSLELLATASIVSAYEMLDGSRTDWERHLRGLSCIQHSQGIHGDSGGLKQAVWWTWLCQDVWAAWREGRKPLTTWRPDKQLSELDNFELAARSVYLFAQTVGFCSKEELALGQQDAKARLAKAQGLQLSLNRWHKCLPPDFNSLPLDISNYGGVFEPMWIHPPNFGVAVQLYHCSRVLILTNSPCLGGMAEYQKQRKELDQHIGSICGIAVHLKGDPESVMCSQALFIAGLFINEQRQREAVLEMLDSCWRRAGWPHESLSVELQRRWNEDQ